MLLVVPPLMTENCTSPPLSMTNVDWPVGVVPTVTPKENRVRSSSDSNKARARMKLRLRRVIIGETPKRGSPAEVALVLVGTGEGVAVNRHF